MKIVYSALTRIACQFPASRSSHRAFSFYAQAQSSNVLISLSSRLLLDMPPYLANTLFYFIIRYSVPKLRYDYEAHCSWVMINFGRLEFFNGHVNLSTRAFLHMGPIEM